MWFESYIWTILSLTERDNCLFGFTTHWYGLLFQQRLSGWSGWLRSIVTNYNQGVAQSFHCFLHSDLLLGV